MKKKLKLLKQRPTGEVFSVCMNLVRFEAEISCAWHSSLKTGPLLTPSLFTWLLLSPESMVLQIPTHMSSLSPKGNSPGTSSSPRVPRAAHSPLADGSRSCSLFPRSTNVQSSCIAALWTRASWLCVSSNPNTGQGCAGCNKPLQGCKTGQRSQRVQLCLDND